MGTFQVICLAVGLATNICTLKKYHKEAKEKSAHPDKN